MYKQHTFKYHTRV